MNPWLYASLFYLKSQSLTENQALQCGEGHGKSRCHCLTEQKVLLFVVHLYKVHIKNIVTAVFELTILLFISKTTFIIRTLLHNNMRVSKENQFGTLPWNSSNEPLDCLELQRYTINIFLSIYVILVITFNKHNIQRNLTDGCLWLHYTLTVRPSCK